MKMEFYSLIRKPHSSNAVMTQMLTCTLLFMITTFIISPPVSAAAAAASTNIAKSASIKFIKNSCSTTTYPSLCYQILSPYASTIKTSPLKLTTTSLTLSIKFARNTATVVSRLAKQNRVTKFEAAAIRDCIENLNDSVDEFKQAQKALLSGVGGHNMEFQMNNAKTWASAAITDENTCLDGFSGRKVNPLVKNKIGSTIKTVGQLSSVSLSLITHLKF